MTVNPLHPASTGLKPGDRLVKYDVLEQIGAGGMSVVWKGYDRLLGRAVAIKQIAIDAPGGAGPDDHEAFRQRFMKEAAIQKRLGADHKHLVRVLDFIDNQRGLFIVMEYVDGPSLEQMLEQAPEPMDPRQALGIISATAKALAAIHDQGVLHRDLKPSNILLPREGGLKVCDFGLAALLADQDALTLGSARYMAPEAFSSDKLEPRCDIYSLGVIAYEILVGRARFNEAFRIVLRDQRNQALRWMKWHTNPRIKAPPLHELNPGIDRTLSDVVARMMEKDPLARIDSAPQLLKAIHRQVTGQTEASALRATARARAKAAKTAAAAAHEATAPLPRRSKLPLVLGAMLLFWLVVFVGVFLYFQMKSKAELRARHDAAVALFEQARQELQNKDFPAAQDKFNKLAADWPDDDLLGRGSAARALFAGAEQALDQGDYNLAESTYQQVDKLDVLERDLLQDKIRAARAGSAFQQEVALIDAHIAAGRFDDARVRLGAQRTLTHTQREQELIAALGQKIEDQAALAQAEQLMAKARDLAGQGRRSEAISLLAEAQRKLSDHRLKELEDQIGRDDRYEMLLAQAQAAERDGDLAKAVDAYQQALELKTSDPLQRTLNQARSRAAYQEGRQLLDAGDMAGAQAAFTRALGFPDIDNEQAKAALANIDSTTKAMGFVRAADAAVRTGDYEQAVQQYDNALKIAPSDAVQAKRQAAKAGAMVKRGQQLLKERQVAAAKQAFTEAQALVADAPGAAEGLQSAQQLGDYLAQLQAGDEARQKSNFGDAKRSYERAAAIMPTDEIHERINRAEFDQFMAQASSYMQAGQWAAARGSLKSAAKLYVTDQLKAMLDEIYRNAPSLDRDEQEPSDGNGQ